MLSREVERMIQKAKSEGKITERDEAYWRDQCRTMEGTVRLERHLAQALTEEERAYCRATGTSEAEFRQGKAEVEGRTGYSELDETEQAVCRQLAISEAEFIAERDGTDKAANQSDEARPHADNSPDAFGNRGRQLDSGSEFFEQSGPSGTRYESHSEFFGGGRR
jgi:hypothetical protein